MTRALAVGIAVLLGGYLLVTSTVTLHETLWKYDVKRILELCILPLIFAALLLNGSLRQAFQQQIQRIPRWMAAALLAVLALGLVSSLHNSNSTMALLYSLSEVSLLGLLVVAAMGLAACRQVAGKIFEYVVVVLLAMTAVAVGLQELLGVTAALASGVEFHPRIALLHFSWPRFYNDMQSWSIPVIASLPLLFPGKPLARVLCLAALVLEWYVLIATGGRATLVGVGFALFVAAVFLPAIRKTLVRYQLAGLLGGVLVYLLVVAGHQRLPDEGLNEPAPASQSAVAEATPGQPLSATTAQAIDDASGKFIEPLAGERMWTSSGRVDMWRGSVRDVQAHPVLGLGPMNYACAGPIYRAGHPHNFPLQFMSEWGIPAALLLFITAGVLFFRLARALRTPGEYFLQSAPLAGFFATGVLAAMVSACFSGVLVMPESQITGVLVCGCLLWLAPRHVKSRNTQRGGMVLLAAALAVSLALLVFARQELAVSEQRFEQTPLMDRGIPRFWQNGKVCGLYQRADQQKMGPE